MDWEFIKNIAHLTSEVVIVIAFLRYLVSKDQTTKVLAEEGHEVVRSLGVSFHELKGAIELQTQEMRHSNELLANRRYNQDKD